MPCFYSTYLLCQFERNYVTDDGGHVLAYSGLSNELYIYNLNDSSYPQVQVLSFSSSILLFLDMTKGEYILFSSTSILNFYHFNTSTNTYQLNFTQSFSHTTTYTSASFTSDGFMIAYVYNLWNDPDITLRLFVLNQNTGLYSETVISMNLTGGASRSVRDIAF